MIILIAASLCAMLAGLALVGISRQERREEPGSVISLRTSDVPQIAVDYLARAGIDMEPRQVWLLITVFAVVAAGCFVWMPWLWAAVLVISLALLADVVLRMLGNRLRHEALNQLPSFLNQVIRRVSSGTAIEHAITDSIRSVDKPLSVMLQRAVSRVRLGFELHHSFDREAQITRLQEFRMLATVVRLNEQFGGSIRGVLENIVDILLLQEHSKRELKALTGETRITAIVLSVLPIGAAAYMMVINPDFILTMWNDSSGYRLLVTAAVLQCLGVVMLWRMVRSI